MMYQSKKHYLLLVVSKLVEARNFQHLPKIHSYPYVPVHFSRSRRIWNPLSKIKRAGLVGCARTFLQFFC